MAAVDVKSLDQGTLNQLALGYATLLLHDGSKPVNHENLKAVINAAGVKTDDALIKIFGKALQNLDVSKLFSVGGGGAAPAQTSSSAPAGGSGAAQPTAKAPEPKKEEKVEEEDVDVGVGDLFGF